MNRAVAIAGIALFSVFLLPGVAVASHTSGPGGPRDFAVGGGTTGSPSDPSGVQHVDFAASGGPTTFDLVTGFGGDPVTGHFRAGGDFGVPGTEFQQEGPVTCLVVDGNRATLVYPNKQATPETPLEDLEVLIFLEDNGPPVNGQPMDKLGFVLLPDETPADDPPSEQDEECVVPPVPFNTPFTLQKGNFTIHDAP